MGPAELQIEIFWRRNLLGKRRYDIRIRDISNDQVLMTSSQRYSRLTDANRTAAKIGRYAHIADIVEVGHA